MKHGVRPTREQRKLIGKAKLDPMDWLVVKDMPTEMLLQNRTNKEIMHTIVKGVRNENS